MKSALIVLSLFLPLSMVGQNITGKWKSIDDSSGEARSIVEIGERNGELYGKVIKLFVKPGEDQDPVCDKCATEDFRFDKKIIGMEIISGLARTGDTYSGGEILDPENGKVYRCKVWIENQTLKVRGYLGPFFRTQTWHRIAAAK